MYCPKCGAQNIDGASFCRSCGTNLSLVPQALTGRLPEAGDVEGETGSDQGSRRKRRGKGPPSVEKAITNIFMGVGFLFVSLAIMKFAPAGRLWWFWMLIPAFSLLGGGVAEFVRSRQSQPAAPPSFPPYTPPGAPMSMSPPVARGSALPPRDTGELYTPASVTEGTTRLLEHEPQARKSKDEG